MTAYTDRHRTDDPPPAPTVAHYRLWVNVESTLLVRLWDSGALEVATRDSPSHTWGPPIDLAEEPV